jgi:extracellular elastinolytic metalloproteinase
VPREIDLRTALPADRLAARTAALRDAAAAMSAGLTGGATVLVHRVDIMTGGAADVRVSGFAPDTGAFVSRALSFLATTGAAFGLLPGQAPEFVANPHPVTTNSGARSVYVQQQAQSVPIFQAGQTVVFGPDGAVQKSVGTAVTVAPDDSQVNPALAADQAVLAALRFLVENPGDPAVDGFGSVLSEPALDAAAPAFVESQFADRPDLPTVVACAAFAEPILLALTWFPLNETLVLCWEMVVTLPEHAGAYRILLGAARGDIVYSAQIVRSIGATAQVYVTDPRQARQTVSWPPVLASYGLPVPAGLPAAFPYPWVDGATSSGGDAVAHLNDADPPLPADTGTQFAAADPLGLAQCVVNGFYFMCYMHDFLYLLGFREADGNFQADDFGLGGAPGDRVDVRVYPGPVWATANMSTPVDGLRPVMKLGLVTATGRHSALDASVVFHEATHGLTARLVGGALNNQALEQPQSAGMSEGWSDFVACQILGSTVVGAWVVDKPAGIRGFPYDAAFPGTFADLGTGRYTEVHAIGELWCATLSGVARGIGRARAMRLLVDSLKLAPANPSFLDGRDAILLALDHDLASGAVSPQQYATEKAAMRAAFARAGLGPAARGDDSFLTGIVADFGQGPAPATDWTRTGPAGRVPPDASIAVDTAGAIYVVGGDGKVYVAARSGSTWSAWAQTGPAGTVPPKTSIALDGSGAMYVVGGDGHLYVSARSGPWAQTGPAGTVPPNASIAVDSSGALYVVGGDGHVYLSARSGPSWSGWTQTGPAGTVPPNASIAVDSTGAIYVVGGDGHLYVAQRNGSSWAPTGPSGTIPPGASIAVSGAADLYAVGADGSVLISG